MAKAAIAFGSNLGDKLANLQEALALLAQECVVLKKSRLYQTEPVGYLDQDWFLNGAILVETERLPLDLLDLCQSIERAMGRERLIHWGPRNIDLDLLLYEEEIIDHPRLTVPHPRLWERRFVLQPLADIVPMWSVPGHSLVKDLLAAYCGDEKITVYIEGKW